MFKRPVVWTSEDEEFLKNNYLELGAIECASRLGRTTSATRARCQFLGLKRRSISAPFTPEDDDFILTFSSEMSLAELSSMLNKSTSSVRQRLKDLSLLTRN